MNTQIHHPVNSFQNTVLKAAQNLVPISRAIFGNGVVSAMTLSIAYRVERLTSSRR